MGPRVMERMNRHTLRIKWHKDIPGKSVGQDLFVKNAKKKKKKRRERKKESNGSNSGGKVQYKVKNIK